LPGPSPVAGEHVLAIVLASQGPSPPGGGRRNGTVAARNRTRGDRHAPATLSSGPGNAGRSGCGIRAAPRHKLPTGLTLGLEDRTDRAHARGISALLDPSRTLGTRKQRVPEEVSQVLDDRKLAVLRAIVEDYVSTNEPVGSKALADRHNLGVS